MAINISCTGNLRKIKNALENPTEIVKKAAQILLRTSQQAFSRQRLGDIEWPGRYPNQPDPFVNYAGALEDLRKGPRVKERRFQRRPVLVDYGNLKRSLSFNMAGGLNPTAEIGSTLPYAAIHQEGNVATFQTIDQTVRDNLTKYLKGVRKKEDRSAGGPTPARFAAVVRSAAAEKLTVFYHQDILVTEHQARPFLGVTDEALERIGAMLARAFGGKGQVSVDISSD